MDAAVQELRGQNHMRFQQPEYIKNLFIVNEKFDIDGKYRTCKNPLPKGIIDDKNTHFDFGTAFHRIRDERYNKEKLEMRILGEVPEPGADIRFLL